MCAAYLSINYLLIISLLHLTKQKTLM